MKKKTALLIAILSFVAIVFSCLIILLHKDNTALQGICSAIDPSNPCLKVQESQYAAFFGFDNAYFGIVAFFILFALAVVQASMPQKGIRAVVILGCIIAGLFGLAFTFLQAFVIHALCLYCTVVDVVSVALLVIGLLEVRKCVGKKKVRKAGEWVNGSF